MGAAYMTGVLGIKDPRVGLANIGTEPEKGNKLAKETHELMAKQTSYHFAGNVEAREIISGDCQVIVLDGFDGNLILKYTEGLASAMSQMLKEELLRDARSKLGALFVKPALRRFKARMDYREHGGAPLLGVDGALVKAHGSSDARAIETAIGQARNMIKNDVVGKIRAGVAGLAAADDKGDK
jgi:glycerol-3-phosphate acyltransferase PlsX